MEIGRVIWAAVTDVVYKGSDVGQLAPCRQSLVHTTLEMGWPIADSHRYPQPVVSPFWVREPGAVLAGTFNRHLPEAGLEI